MSIVQSRPNDAWETTKKKGAYRRLTLRRKDGRVYLNRYGLSRDTLGGFYLHHMEAPDPGADVHNHPWWFCSLILWGGYTEVRADVCTPDEQRRVTRKWLSVKALRLDECHTIVSLNRKNSWSLVLKGPIRRKWGFYVFDRWLPEAEYDAKVRADRRDLWSDQNVANKPWSDA